MKLLIFGDPVEHSLSPVIMGAALRRAGIAGSYGRRRVDAAGMREGAAQIRDGRLDGANVTMPHKRLAAELCDRLTPQAERCGVANTLWRRDGLLHGHTTDPDGVTFAWEDARLPNDAPVLVLGAGGAAAAALLALEGRELRVSARRPQAAAALAGGPVEGVGTAEWGRPVPGAVVVNATPLGLAGESLPEAVLEEAAGLFEMNYGHGPTPAMRTVREAGRPVATGEMMLVGQAVTGFRIWTGVSVPAPALLRALAEARPSPPGAK